MNTSKTTHTRRGNNMKHRPQCVKMECLCKSDVILSLPRFGLLYYDHGVRYGSNGVGTRLSLKFGKSYEEKEIERLEYELRLLNKAKVTK